MDFVILIVVVDEDICVDEELEEEEVRFFMLVKMDLGCFCGVVDFDVLEGLYVSMFILLKMEFEIIFVGVCNFFGVDV